MARKATSGEAAVPFSAPRIPRTALGIQYALLAVAGAGLMSSPSDLLESAMGVVVYGWAAFLVIGGMLCLVGSVTKIWIGEFTGLILLMTANVVWGGALIASTPSLTDTPAKYGLVLIAWAFGFAYRWGEIFFKIRGAARAARGATRARKWRRGDRRG